MPFFKKACFCQSQTVNLRTKTRVLFFEETCFFGIITVCLFYIHIPFNPQPPPLLELVHPPPPRSNNSIKKKSTPAKIDSLDFECTGNAYFIKPYRSPVHL